MTARVQTYFDGYKKMTIDRLDVGDLPQEKVNYLQRLIEQWRQEAAIQKSDKPVTNKNTVFATHDSDVVGGEFKRSNAYE